MSGREQLLAEFAALLQRAGGDAALLGQLQEQLQAAMAAAAPAAAGGGDDGFHGLLGDCPPMLQVRRLIEKFAPAEAPVLITGESGTGKEVVARALHALSRRARGPLVVENCAAIPATLLESVLFGHVRGSFTGAIKDHPGHFVAADKGTLFLDEIGDMPLPMQVKLLRVLQEGEVRPVGGSKVRKIDVRVLAATNQQLEEMVAQGRFREDLYYRLNVLRLPLPPLRERGADVVLLAERFLQQASRRSGRPLLLSAAAKAAIAAAPWPGNVRQLQNEMQRVAALSDGPEVQPGELSGGAAAP